MKRTVFLTVCLVLITLGTICGCDSKPSPLNQPGSSFKTLQTLEVSPDNTGELDLVTNTLKAEVNYNYRLIVLREYYEYIGNADKLNWTKNEIANLDEARWFQWLGVPQVVAPEGESVADGDEKLLVEYVLKARREYKNSMLELHEFYIEHNDQIKAEAIERTIKRFDPVRTYMYYFAAELPTARGSQLSVIPEAESLYREAYKLYQHGQIFFGVTSYNKEREAIVKFLELLDKYPTSTKCPMAAFYVGQIYREYFNEDVRAVMWYERAWELDPDMQEGARFQAAVVYDFRLHNRQRAYELYKEALKHETANWNNSRYATQRIGELEEMFAAEKAQSK